MNRFCEYCGAPLKEGAKFCSGCGHPVTAKPQSQPQPNPQPQQRPQPQPPHQPKAEPKVQVEKPKKKGGCGKVLLIVALIAVLGYAGWEYYQNKEAKRTRERLTKDYPEKMKELENQNKNQGQGNSAASAGVLVYQGEGFSQQVGTDAQEGGVTLGGINTAGMKMFVENGTFPYTAEIEAQPIAQEHLDVIKNSGKFDMLFSPTSISCDQYDGSFFGSEVILTMPMPRRINDGEEADLNKYIFVCYDEGTKQMRYLWPTEYDSEKNTMSVRMPHFSGWLSAKMTQEEEVEAYLDSYSTKMAVQNSLRKQAAEELQPYVEAKVKALNLTKEAAKDLLQATVNVVVAKATSSYESNDGKYDWQESYGYSNGAKVVTSTIRGVWTKDSSAIDDGMKDLVNSSLMEAWNDLKFNDRAAATLFKSVNAQELASGAIGTVASNTQGIASMAGCLMEGDTKGAMKELGNILQNIHPAAELGTKGAKFIATAANSAFTNWKANEVEELYQIYKNGGRFLFGNEVLPDNKDNTFVDFMNYSSGFTKAKCVYRFFNMDKTAEVCEKYGWSGTDYEHLDQHYKDIFNQRALDGLLNYFETRKKQEAEAEKIKAMERKSIEAMLGDFGALNADYHKDYFREGEKYGKGFNVTNRLERIAQIRASIAQFVDEQKLKQSIKDDSFNWGDLVNKWISLVEDGPKQDVTKKFCEYLKECDLLKKDIESAEETDKDNGGYCWRLVRTEIDKSENVKTDIGIVRNYFASETEHSVEGVHIGNGYKAFPYSFKATIQAPPELIQGDDSLVLHATLRRVDGAAEGYIFENVLFLFEDESIPQGFSSDGAIGAKIINLNGSTRVGVTPDTPSSGTWDYVIHIPSGKKDELKALNYTTCGSRTHWVYKWCSASE